jgi:hypothetical protein
MQPIINNYNRFADDLNRNHYISCDKGQWKTDNAIVRFIRWLFGWESKRLQNIVKTFNSILDQLESQPFYYRVDETITAQSIINLSNSIHNYTHHDNSCSRALNEMKLKIISLRYRMQISEPERSTEDLKQNFRQLVLRWKEHDPLYVNKALDAADERKVEEFCRYPEFAQHLVNHPEQAFHQLKIGIRDNVDVRALIEFNHHVTKILYESHLTCRVGAFSQPLLKVWDGHKKNLELIIEGRQVDILNPQLAVTFSDGFRATIQDIFHSYKHLNNQPTSGEYEFFMDGLRRWNGHQWGPKKMGQEGYHSIDVSQPRFWEKPDFPIYDIVTKEQIERKYQIAIRDPSSSIQVLEATRLNRGIGLDGHGYTIFYIPGRDPGTYKVIPVGLYANRFPVTHFEKASFISATTPGTIVFPDPNYTYTRQKASIAKEISDEQLEMQMRRIAATRINGGWFMWTWENCCHYAKNLFLNVIENDPRLHSIIKKRTFKVPFIECRPDQWLITLIQKGYKICQLPYLKTAYEEFTFLILGTRRELSVKESVFEDNQEFVMLKTKSSYTSKFCRSKTNNLPAVFHNHVERNEIPGAVLIYGHGRF